MQPLQFGTVDAALATVLPILVLVLGIANVATRFLAHRTHVSQADEHGAEGVERYTPHTVLTLALVLVTFGYVLVDLHIGVALAAFALTAFIADFFEFEARLVEARTDRPLEAPKGAIGASLLIVVYAGFHTLIVLFGSFWSPVI